MQLEPLDAKSLFGYGKGIYTRHAPVGGTTEGRAKRDESENNDDGRGASVGTGKLERLVGMTPKGILRKTDNDVLAKWEPPVGIAPKDTPIKPDNDVLAKCGPEGMRLGPHLGFGREVGKDVFQKAWPFGKSGKVEKRVRRRMSFVAELMEKQWEKAGRFIRVPHLLGGQGKGKICGGGAGTIGGDKEKERIEAWEKDMQEKVPELVELWEQNPEFKRKIKMKHGVRMAEMVEAEGRKRERDRRIQEVELDLERLVVKGKVGKGVEGMSARLKVMLGMKDNREGDEGESVPGNANHFDVVYWEEDGRNDMPWEEKWNEQTMEEKERKVTVVDEKSVYSALTESAVRRLQRIMGNWRYATGRRQLANINGCIITDEDLMRLRPGVWLNDEIVNAYLELVGKRMEEFRGEEKGGARKNGRKAGKLPKIKIMNSFFYSKLVSFSRAQQCSEYDYTRVRRWTRRFDVFSYDMMIIPINQQNTHWTLGVVNFRDKYVMHLDSLGNGGSSKIREYLMRWVKDEAEDKKMGEGFVESEWKMVARPDVPRQENSDDCGVFTCKFADFLARGWNQFSFDQRHMNYFRSRIAHELLMARAT